MILALTNSGTRRQHQPTSLSTNGISVFLCVCSCAENPEPAEVRENLPVVDNVPIQPRRVSGQYFFEYLVVVSLKKTKDGSNYEPQITYQFPKVSHAVKTQV